MVKQELINKIESEISLFEIDIKSKQRKKTMEWVIFQIESLKTRANTIEHGNLISLNELKDILK